jgi:MFS family permease
LPFIAGAFILGVTHLIGGFMRDKIALLVLRALGGIGGALTIPSALSLIVQLFPNPAHQARAIALFGSAGAIGNVLGILIGAVLVQYAGWSWIFWFVAIVGILVAAICLFLIPNARRNKELNVKFDVPGVSLLTVAVILFIFAVTSGQPKGWGSAYVLAPLIISLAITAVFLWWEAHTNPDDAVLPPRMWRYRNFGVLATLALLPYFWWVTSFINLVAWWEQVYGWTAISTAVHFLPMGIFAWLISMVTGRLPTWFAHKYIILAGLFLAIVATILLPFADSPSTYWPFIFPAFTLGTIGCMIVYANSSIAIFSYTPPHVAGTVGAVFNSALQLGSAVGIAAVSSLTTSVDAKANLQPPITQWSQMLDQITSEMWKEAYKGRSSAFWFLLGILLLVTIAVIVFFKVDLPVHDEKPPVEKKDVEASPGLVEKN